MKTYKNIGFGPRKNKKGFTLIELLIVMVILAILAGVVVMAIGGVFGTSRERAYDVTKQEMKNAVAQYASENAGDLPLLATTINISECSGTCYVVNMSPMLVSAGGILGKLPDSCSVTNEAACTGSYTWASDIYGNIYSACISGECPAGAGNASGYADGFWEIYP